MIIIEHPCPGAFCFNLGPFKFARVGCLAQACFGLFHVVKVGRKFGFGWGPAN